MVRWVGAGCSGDQCTTWKVVLRGLAACLLCILSPGMADGGCVRHWLGSPRLSTSRRYHLFDAVASNRKALGNQARTHLDPFPFTDLAGNPQRVGCGTGSNWVPLQTVPLRWGAHASGVLCPASRRRLPLGKVDPFRQHESIPRNTHSGRTPERRGGEAHTVVRCGYVCVHDQALLRFLPRPERAQAQKVC